MISMKNGIALLTVTGAAACAAGEAQWAGSITDSAGVQMVSNTAEGIWTDETRWTLVEELRIGSLDEEPEYQFGQVGGVAVSSDGSMFVLDTQGQHVKMFSADGQYVRTLGGPGSGPGEIGPPSGAPALVIAGGDTVLVPDLANQRVNRYLPDGSVLSSFPLDFQNIGFPFGWQTTSTGLVAMQVRPVITGEEGSVPHDFIYFISADGTITDTITSFVSGKTFSFGGGLPEWHIYSPETVWRLTDDGQLLRGVNDAYRLTEYTPSDSLTRVITMPFELRPVAERDMEAIRTLFRELFEGNQQIPPTFIPRLLERVHFGETLPAFAQLQIGPAGSIWIQHVRSASELSDEQISGTNFLEEFGSPNWDVLDRGGRYLGVVTLPDRFAPRAILGDRMYGVWRDEFDVQYIMRLRIEGAEAMAE